MSEKKIDHEFTDQIVCPYCGWEDRDSWEFDQNDGEMECGNCGEVFNVYRDISITYTTEKKETEDHGK